MKKALLFLVLVAANIWACTKDFTPVTSTQATPDNEVTDRAITIGITGGAGFTLCGVNTTPTCTVCNAVPSGAQTLTNFKELATLRTTDFCLTNNNATAVGVTVAVSSCTAGITVLVPAGATVCYTISGCTITAC